MSDENNYMIWAFLKKCHERGFVYRGRDTMPWCPRCATGISQHEMHEGYIQVEDDSVVAQFPLRGRTREYLLVWTTTPWTLPANVACAVNPELSYSRVRQGDATYYLATSRLAEMAPYGQVEVLDQFPGERMDGWTYQGPFDDLPAAAELTAAHRVVTWDLVSGSDGTGIVHVAPGCGREDFDLGRRLGLPAPCPIDEEGVYVSGYGEFTGKAASVVPEAIIERLRARGFLYSSAPYTHSYPHCWRCRTPLVFRCVDEWFIDMSWRDEIEASARAVRWMPAWGLDRELDWLANMRDWMISKKRYWGLALPIFRCACGWFDVIGSREELRARAVEGWDRFDGHSPHRPWIDALKVRCGECGAAAARIPDVGNPWLDAGIVPYSTVRYADDRAYWREWIPADLVTECFPGQFRNWFYALLAMSTMMEGIAPFKTLLGHALVKDEKGEEMHKSAGNAIWFDDAAERMGCDVMRWIFCRQEPANNLNFGWTLGVQTRRKVFNTLWNVYAFFCNYARLDGFELSASTVPCGQRPDIDRWLLSDLQLLVQTARRSLAEYDAPALVREAEAFIERLSNWYVRRSRRRFWRPRGQDDREKFAAYQTLHEALTTLCRVLAPIAPFVTEAMYRHLVAAQDASAPRSVHLCDYPEPKTDLIDEELSRAMAMVTECVSAVLAVRKERRLRVRQPLKELVAVTRDAAQAAAVRRLEHLMLDEVNVKRLSVRSAGEGAERTEGERESLVATEAAGFTLIVDTSLTPELLSEGWARDLVRHVQQSRKASGLDMADRVRVGYFTEDRELGAAVETWREYVMAETLCAELERRERGDGCKAVRVGGRAMELWLEKVE
jgi:isoleucyl-tRNA synthetase